MKTAFIGLGIMGSRMAKRLANNHIDLTVYNRTGSKAEDLQNQEIKVAESLKKCVENKDIVFTMLSTPEVVRKMATSKGGFLSHMKEDALWVDCSTVDPASSKYFFEKATNYQIRFMDAPVAGTKQPAEKGELVFLVGGKDDNIKKAEPLLGIMGKKIIHAGGVGSGSSIKMLINLLLAHSMYAFSETVKLGKAMGLQNKLMHDVLLHTPVTAPFLQAIRTKLEEKNTTANFPLKWMHKDLHLVSKTAYENNVAMPLANFTKEIFAEVKTKGLGDHDFSTIYHALNE